MAGSKVGNAYLNVEPKLDGKFQSKMSSEGNASGNAFGGKFGSAVNAKMTAAGVAIGNILSQAVMAAGEMIGKFIGDSIETGASFEASMSNVAALSGATADEFQLLSDTAKQFGASTQFSATEASQALGYMALAGWDAQTSASALGGVLDLAAASSMDLAAASDMVTDYMSAFNMEAEQSAYFADVMAYAQANSNTSVVQLGEAFRNSAANMNAAGQDVETVTALLAAMANQGDKGSRAGTKLSAAMRDITANMENGAISIGDTSVAVVDAEGNFRDLTDILIDIEAATDGMGDAERAAALSATFTSDSIAGLNMILNEGMDSIADFEEQLRGSEGTAKTLAGVMNDNLAGSMKSFNSAVEALQIQTFEAIAPLLRGIVDAGTEAARVIGEFVASFDFSPIQGYFAPAVTAVQGFAQSLYANLTPIIATVAPTVMQVFQTVGNVLGAVMNFIGGIVAAVWPVVESIILNVTSAIGGIIEAVWPAIQMIVTTALNVIEQVVNHVFPFIQSIIGAVMSAVQTVISVAWPIIQGIVVGVMEVISAIVQAVWPAIEAIITAVVTAVTNAIDGWNELVGMVQFVFDSVRSAVEEPIEAARDTVQGVIDEIVGFFTGLGERISSVIGPIVMPSLQGSATVNGEQMAYADITWQATGGILTNATLIGAGEAGAEAIIPLTNRKYTGAFAQVIAEQIDVDGGEELLIRWLNNNLGAIIAANAPTISRRDFDRMARGAIA